MDFLPGLLCLSSMLVLLFFATPHLSWGGGGGGRGFNDEDGKLQRPKLYNVSVLARPHSSPIIWARAHLAPRSLQTWPTMCLLWTASHWYFSPSNIFKHSWELVGSSPFRNVQLQPAVSSKIAGSFITFICIVTFIRNRQLFKNI